ncbi:ubiquitin-like small modifier protein 1 [Methanoculleus sp.]|uniref:ubiquitin-like small modifier protein 1 n=1 Tax=Methanoculleus sp. TaxID=90427 RepID=UPI002630726D|nr:ubiquitin-like small modifier protein 1 [Methanoculleus sp.]
MVYRAPGSDTDKTAHPHQLGVQEGRAVPQDTGKEGTITVKVRAFAVLREIIPAEHNVEIAGGATVGDLLEHLSLRHPGLGDALFTPAGELGAYVNILKNGRNIHFSGGLETPLEDGDIVALFPPAGGG